MKTNGRQRRLDRIEKRIPSSDRTGRMDLYDRVGFWMGTFLEVMRSKPEARLGIVEKALEEMGSDEDPEKALQRILDFASSRAKL